MIESSWDGCKWRITGGAPDAGAYHANPAAYDATNALLAALADVSSDCGVSVELGRGHYGTRQPQRIRSRSCLLGQSIEGTTLIANYFCGPTLFIAAYQPVPVVVDVPPGSGLSQSFRSENLGASTRYLSLRNCGGLFDFAGSADFTWQFAIKFDATGLPEYRSVACSQGKWEEDESLTRGFSVLYRASDGRFQVNLRTNTGNTLSSFQTVTPGVWHRIAITYKGDSPSVGLSTLKVWCDGILLETVTGPGSWLRQHSWECYTIGMGLTVAGERGIGTAAVNAALAWFSVHTTTLTESQIAQNFQPPPLTGSCRAVMTFDPADFAVLDSVGASDEFVKCRANAPGSAEPYGYLVCEYPQIGTTIPRVEIGRMRLTSDGAGTLALPDGSTTERGCTAIYANSAVEGYYHDLAIEDYGGLSLRFDCYGTRAERLRLGTRQFGIFAAKNCTLSSFRDIFVLSGHLVGLFTGGCELTNWIIDSSNAEHQLLLNGGGQFASSYLLSNMVFGAENHVSGDKMQTQLVLEPGVYETDFTLVNCGGGQLSHSDVRPITIHTSKELAAVSIVGGSWEQYLQTRHPLITYKKRLNGGLPAGRVVTTFYGTARWSYAKGKLQTDMPGAPDVKLTDECASRSGMIYDLPYGLLIGIISGGQREMSSMVWSVDGGQNFWGGGYPMPLAPTVSLPGTTIQLEFSPGEYVAGTVYRYHGFVDPDAPDAKGLTRISHQPTAVPCAFPGYPGYEQVY